VEGGQGVVWVVKDRLLHQLPDLCITVLHQPVSFERVFCSKGNLTVLRR
jgi:hypothetical protein